MDEKAYLVTNDQNVLLTLKFHDDRFETYDNVAIGLPA